MTDASAKKVQQELIDLLNRIEELLGDVRKVVMDENTQATGPER